MKTNLLKSLAAAAVLAVTAGAAHADTYPGDIVTIQENAIAGAGNNVFQANQLSGQYDETITIGAGNTYQSTAIFNATNWLLNNVTASTQVGSFSANQYKLYVKFVTTGTFTTSGATTTFTSSTGGVQLWADANSDTKYNVGSSSTASYSDLTLTSGSTADDVLLGTASLLTAGQGNLSGGLANGNFEFIFGDFTLSSTGLAYFIAPRPFDMVIDLNGNFQAISTTAGASTTLLGNSANGFFAPTSVPEPGALALAGIALVGAAFATRRKNRNS